MPAPQIDGEYLGLTEGEMERLQAQIVREFSLWADTPVCDAERIDNFYQLQQLAFLGYLMNGDEIALLPMKRQVGQPYDLRVQLVEADRVCSPDGFDRLMPCTVQGYKVHSIVQGVETDGRRDGGRLLGMQPSPAGQPQHHRCGRHYLEAGGGVWSENGPKKCPPCDEPGTSGPEARRPDLGPGSGEPETAREIYGR